MRPAEIAAALGLATNTVRYHHQRLTAAPQPDPAPPPPSPDAVVRQVKTRDQVHRLLAGGLSRAETARALGLTKPTVTYHARRLGAPVDARCARHYDWTAVQAFYDTGRTVAECVQAFGFSKQTWHAAMKRGAIVSRPNELPLDVLFVAATPRSRGNLKRRLLAAGIKVERCECCGIGEWNGRALRVALHHVNGDRHDNRVENLMLLCPNCHSQTDNFAGRRRGDARPPARQPGGQGLTR